MKIYVVKVITSGPLSWYVRSIGQEFFAEWQGTEDSEYRAICRLSDPMYLEGCYFAAKHVEIVRHFDGYVVPTNTVEIREE